MDLQKLTLNVVENIAKPFEKKMSTIAPVSTDNVEKLTRALDGLSCANSTIIKTTNDVQAKISSLRKAASATSFADFKFNNGKIGKFELFHDTTQGTNFGQYAIDVKTNKLYYLKSGKPASDLALTHIQTQAENEVLASKLYELAGVDCAKMEVITNENGEKFVLSEFIPNLSGVRTFDKGIADGLGLDIWLANWDAICSNNIQTTGNKFYRIDFGGALEYRSLGDLKNSYDGNFEIDYGFNGIVDELTSMFDSSLGRFEQIQNIDTAVTQEDLIFALKKVVALEDEKIKEIVLQYATDEKNAGELTSILLKRKEYLAHALGLIEKTPKSVNQSMFEYLQVIQRQVNASDEFKSLSALFGKNNRSFDKPIQFTQEELAGIAEDKEMKKLYDYYIENYETLPIEDVERDIFLYDDDIMGKKSCEDQLLQFIRPTLKQTCQRYQGWHEYKGFNEHLRDGSLTYSEKTMLNGLNALFDKKGATINDRPECNILYRGVRKDCFWNIGNKNLCISDLKIGDEFIEKGFSSTSIDSTVGESYANGGYLLKIIPNEKTKLLDVDAITGGFALTEKEILLRNNTLYRVADIQGNKITLQVLN